MTHSDPPYLRLHALLAQVAEAHGPKPAEAPARTEPIIISTNIVHHSDFVILDPDANYQARPPRNQSTAARNAIAYVEMEEHYEANLKGTVRKHSTFLVEFQCRDYADAYQISESFKAAAHRAIREKSPLAMLLLKFRSYYALKRGVHIRAATVRIP